MAAILRLAKAYPITFGLVYSGVKTCACDLLVQKVVEKRQVRKRACAWSKSTSSPPLIPRPQIRSQEIDWKRNGMFAAFGFLYLGGVQYYLYVPVFGRLFPQAAAFAAKPVAEKIKDMPGIRSLFSQVCRSRKEVWPRMCGACGGRVWQ